MPVPTFSQADTLAPSPTSQSNALLEAGMQAQANGDYEGAIAAYLELLTGDPLPEQARLARYHLAEAYFLNRDYVTAAADWDAFITAYPQDDLLPQASLMAGRAYEATGDCAQAISYYQSYLASETMLADMVNEWIGDCQAGEQKLEEAIAAYRSALAVATEASVQAGLHEKVAENYIALGNPLSAVSEYDTILKIARVESYRAQIEYLAAQSLVSAGQTETAQVRYRRVVDTYPATEYAYLSLVELVNAGVQVDEFQRGLVDYYAGANHPDAYGAAISAFDRYLAATPAPKADEALYRKAVAQRASDQPQAALATLETLITGHPKSTWLPQAWLEKATALAAMGSNDAAVKAYQDLAAFFPAHDLAPEGLWRAAKLREGAGAYTAAASLYMNLQTSFPGYTNAEEALWRAGLDYYRVKDEAKAIAAWQSLHTKYPKSAFETKVLYWLGKVGATPSKASEQGYWDQLTSIYPANYYALRVEQVRSGEAPTAARLNTAAVQPPPWDKVEASQEILSWLQGWTRLPAGTDLLTLPITLTQQVDFRRGQALLAVGLRREALTAWDRVRAAAWDDPLSLARLALFFKEQGIFGLASRAASRLATLKPQGTIYNAPGTVQCLAYPLPYIDLLNSESQERGLDPLFLAALIRQESLFEPVAVSSAGARGLGQVMPGTGEGIARNLGMQDFVVDDLYRPIISIRFGAYYVSAQLNHFDKQLYVALAAYNGGPGNATHWLEAGGADLDFFVEVIGAQQSRTYLQRVYEQYVLYEKLYRTSQGLD
jgi:soluble lytic murein transglycosylase